MKYYILLFLFFFINNTYAQNISAQQAQSDIIFLQQALADAHPGNEFAINNAIRLLHTLQSKITDSIGIRSFYKEIRYYTTMVNCVHTYTETIKMDLPPIKPNYFPFDVFIDGRKLFLIKQLGDTISNITLPLEVVSINAVPTAYLIDKMWHYRSSDGNLITTNNSYTKDYGYFFLAGFLNYPDSFIVTVKNPDRTFKIASIQSKPVQEVVELNTLLFEMEDCKFYRLNNDTAIYVLDINGFPDHKYSAFYKSVFNYIESNKVNNLVIDLRDNLGGNRNNLTEFLGYFLDSVQTYHMTKKTGAAKPYVDKRTYFLQMLKFNVGEFYRCKYENGYATFTYKIKPHKYRYEGNLYVLVNGKSASASGITAAYLRRYTDAVLIGEETAGGLNGNNGGSYCKLILPNSTIQIQFPIFHLSHDFFYDYPYTGVMPDFEITYSAEEIINYADKEMLLVKKMCQQ